MALRQFAVFMNAGSNVISPKSSGPALICRRSIARMVPSWIGRSYFFPVRLSTIVSVSAIGLLVVFLGVGRLVSGDAVPSIRPLSEIAQLAPFAAERPPPGIDRADPAHHAYWRVGHPIHFILALLSRRDGAALTRISGNPHQVRR